MNSKPYLPCAKSKKLEDDMFQIGDRETKISVTAWKGTVKVHLRKFFQSSFDRRKFGSCLLWVMLSEISVDIAVDSQSIVSRYSGR